MTTTRTVHRLLLVTVLPAVLAIGCGGGRSQDHGAAAPDHGAADHDHAAAGHDHAHPHDHGRAGGAGPMDDHELQHVRSGPEPCRCTRARVVNGWCAHCRVGYMAAIPVPSAALFELIDTHGHDFAAERIDCRTCRDAMTRDGHCPRCGIGFVGDRMFLSSLTWALVQGSLEPAAPGGCGGAAGHVRDGWCEACGVGRAGAVVLRDRVAHDVAAAELPRLRRALAHAVPCDNCAAAAFSGIVCRVCGTDHSVLDNDGAAGESEG